ncbi:MAG: CBS domain-containing protein [bacterium]|nr:CBS domain-containing protein [bacterium]
MLVKDIMNKDVIYVGEYTTLRELLIKFDNFHTFPLVPVVDEDKKLVGLVRLRNLIDVFFPYNRELLRISPFVDEVWDENIFKVEIGPELGILVVMADIMDEDFAVIKGDEEIEKAYEQLKIHKSEQMPVVDGEGRLQGIIGLFDIVRYLFKQKGIY